MANLCGEPSVGGSSRSDFADLVENLLAESLEVFGFRELWGELADDAQDCSGGSTMLKLALRRTLRRH